MRFAALKTTFFTEERRGTLGTPQKDPSCTIIFAGPEESKTSFRYEIPQELQILPQDIFLLLLTSEYGMEEHTHFKILSSFSKRHNLPIKNIISHRETTSAGQAPHSTRKTYVTVYEIDDRQGEKNDATDKS